MFLLFRIYLTAQIYGWLMNVITLLCWVNESTVMWKEWVWKKICRGNVVIHLRIIETETIGRFDIWGIIYCIRSTHNNTRNYTIIAPFLFSYCCRVSSDFVFITIIIVYLLSLSNPRTKTIFFFFLIFLHAHARTTSSLFPERRIRIIIQYIKYSSVYSTYVLQ